MLKAIICIGISASGKTTFAKTLDNSWVNVNRDDLRFSLTNATDWGNYKFKKATETMITNIQKTIIRNAHSEGKNVVISDTNLNPKYRESLVDFLTTLGYVIERKYFYISLEEAWKRDSLRKNGVGHSVIYKQYQKFKKETSGGCHHTDRALPEAIICDIVRTGILDLVQSYLYTNPDIKLIFLSGRSEVCYDETINWLTDYLWPSQETDFELFMRGEKDCRKDTEVKLDLFTEKVKPNFNVKMVFDDRPCMVRMWYDIGIKNVICVGNPWVEF